MVHTFRKYSENLRQGMKTFHTFVNMKRIALLIMAIAASVSCNHPLPEVFGSIGGTVQDSRTGNFVSGVAVTINPLGYSQVTGSDGTFQYDDLEQAEYTLVFAKAGFESVKHKVAVKPGVISSVQIMISPSVSSVSVDPSVLDFGTKKTEMTMKLTSNSPNVPYTLTSSNSWITLGKTSGTISSEEYVPVIVSRSGLSPASYNGTVFVTSGGQDFSVAVKMEVAASGVPAVTMESLSGVSSSSVTASGNLTFIGDSKVSQYGFCWSSVNQSPDLSDQSSNLGDASDVKSFTADIIGLEPQTTYYVRSYAVNSYGTSYSEDVLSVTTSADSSDDGSQDELSVPQGLVSYYTFDYDDASDITENELDATLVNDPSFIAETVNGKGKALALNGIKEQFMSIPYNVFKNLTKITVSFWIKDFGAGVIFSAISPDYIRSDHPRLIADTDNMFRFYTGYDNYDQTPSFSYPYTSIQSGKWHHVVVSMNGDTRYLYVDGVRTDSNTTSSWSSSHTCTKICIGGNNEGKYKLDCMTMKIDNIRFYQRCISDDEVKKIYNSER